ncbi:MAG: LysR substrate-binding domain-containing protein [Humibacillus sp.]|nr:LysR substrate-binding domain-containing protein [Humibacillus sp.]MDN5775779.1 LysR substrate-binding domain-containing protein [Humibacillus sp.]
MSQVAVSLAGLRAIEALATHGSISAAAVALGYTPSAVSQQILRLERDLRQSLVERGGRRATLTQPGEILALSARRIIIELESMNARLQADAQTVTGTLTVAAFPSAARGVLPIAMSRLLGHWPQLQLRLMEVSSHRAVDLVAGGSADLAVAHDWIGVNVEVPADVVTRHLGDDVSDVLVSSRHPMAAKPDADLLDFADDAWLFEPGSVAHEFLLHAFRGVDESVSLGHMISEYSTQVEMVGAGLGVALAPRMGRGRLPDTVRAVGVRSPPLRRIFGAWRSSSDGRPAIEAALQELEHACLPSQDQPR